jgi:putative phosphoesterase
MRILRAQPDVVVFGHTHRSFGQSVDGTFFFNPGYAGKPRFAQPRSVAILHLGKSVMTPEIIPL